MLFFGVVFFASHDSLKLVLASLFLSVFQCCCGLGIRKAIVRIEYTALAVFKDFLRLFWDVDLALPTTENLSVLKQNKKKKVIVIVPGSSEKVQHTCFTHRLSS